MADMTGIQPGDPVVIERNGKIVKTGKCTDVLATQVILTRIGRISIRTGKQIGGDLIARRVTVAEHAEAIARLDQEEREEHARQQQEEEVKAQAEYDALPEGVKLARSLRWLCDCEREDVIAQAPIEALRAIVTWAKERKLTTS